MILNEPAYGKLNLTLDVLGKREDDYHDLRMVMCSVELHDTVTLKFDEAIGTCSVRTESGVTGVPEGERNLAWKALRAYADAAGLGLDDVSVEIVKRIPAQAGMAGGSSDAAAVLRALNRRFGAFSDEQLRELGLRLGSDVPYCLFGGVALAEGRGERLTRLSDLPDGLCAVLVRPEFSVSTPALFAALDDTCSCHSERSEESFKDSSSHTLLRMTSGSGTAMIAALKSGDAKAIGAALHNDFASVLAAEFPVVETVKAALREYGALGAELTGTGSVVYGLFADRAAAEQAAEAMAQQYPFAVGTNFI